MLRAMRIEARKRRPPQPKDAMATTGPTVKPLRVVVIGGGIGGLASAYRMRQAAGTANVRITVLDAALRFGGVIRSSERDGFLLEHGPDSILSTKPAGLRLIRDLDLEDRIQGTNPALSSGLIAAGDRLLPIPEGLYLLAPSRLWPFALSPLLSWAGKLRMAADLVLPRRSIDAPEESLADFVRRRLGKEALARIAQPLVGGIYTADPEKLSLQHCMPQFATMEREHRSIIHALRKNRKATPKATGTVSGARYGMFVSLQGGLQTLVTRLVEELGDCDLRSDCRVASLSRRGSGFVIAMEGGDRVEADAIVLALPARAAATLCKDIEPELAEDLATISYAGVATINLAFRQADIGPLPTAAGFVVPAVEGRRVLAATFAGTKYLGRTPKDGVLLRAFVGGAMGESELEVDNATLVDRVLEDLRSWIPTLQRPIWSEVHRWPAAMAQPHVGHNKLLTRIRAAEAGICGMALVGNGYEGVGIPDVVEQAERAAEKLMQDLRSTGDEGNQALPQPSGRPPLPDFNRAPFIVIWEATRACDLVCAHCRAEAQPLAHPKELSAEEVRSVMDEVRREFGPVLFVITGGDPLKRAGLLDLIRYGDQIGLRMAITPSATPLLTEKAVADLQAAGIKRIAVSIDGATASGHDKFRGVTGTFERTLRALDVARKLGLSTQINSSIGKHNWHELDDLAALAKNYGVSLWSIFILVPTGRAGSDMLMSPADHEKVYLKLAKLALDPATPFDIKTTAGQPYYRVRAQLAERRGLTPTTTVTTGRGGMRAPGGVNDGNGFLFIDHIGNIQPSGFLPMTCGNVRDRSLAEMYRQHPTFVALRAADDFDGKCGVCEFNILCGGSRSRTYALTGDAFGSDPTCLFEPKAARPSARPPTRPPPEEPTTVGSEG